MLILVVRSSSYVVGDNILNQQFEPSTWPSHAAYHTTTMQEASTRSIDTNMLLLLFRQEKGKIRAKLVKLGFVILRERFPFVSSIVV